MTPIRTGLMTCACALALAACASDKPVEAVGTASIAVAEAERAQAAVYAPGQLNSAQQKLARARALDADGDDEDAQLLAEQARAEANEAKARALEEQNNDVARRNDELARQNVELAAELAEMQAEAQARGTVVTLGDVLFETDQATLTPEGLARVRQIATFLNAHPGQSVVIEGHTDAVGSAGYNQELSEARAATVTAALLASGVTDQRVIYTGLGESSPIASNTSPTGRQLNRRVEVVFVSRG